MHQQTGVLLTRLFVENVIASKMNFVLQASKIQTVVTCELPLAQTLIFPCALWMCVLKENCPYSDNPSSLRNNQLKF
jgi:hypothetical protein